MARVKSKKKRQKVVSKPSVKTMSGRLDLLKRKLEIEREILEQGKIPDEKEIEELDESVVSEEIEDEKTEPEDIGAMEQQVEDFDTKSETKKIRKVEDIIKKKIAKQRPTININSKKLASRIKKYQLLFNDVRKEVGKVVVGQAEAVTGMLRALVADGHVLVEGVPGIAKTTLIRTLAQTTACSFARIQFTPDLLPTDIVGISTYQEGRGFYTLKGPIFNNFILADEINRAPPKVQSALLESMAEKQATIAKETFPVPLPFFTMATQNPVENVGTYSLPEAQIDRFLFKLYMGYPNIDEEQDILRSNITVQSLDSYRVNAILNPDAIVQIQNDAKEIYVDKKVERYIVRLVDATRNPKKYHIGLGKYVEYGSSPRASIGLFKAAKAEALLNGSAYVTPHYVKTVAMDVLRHRVLLSYEGQAEGVRSEQIIAEILKKVPVP
jgi:MoxR-like ATPase